MTVVRLAAKSFDPNRSKPSSREYATRKVEIIESTKNTIRITKDGVPGDYNHYRTVALKSTTDRAVSLLTYDVMKTLRSEYPNYNIQDGDLGENILIDGATFDYFKVGRRYQFIHDDDAMDDEKLVIEITEKMDPCANLCKLSYINDDSLQPKDRIARCQDFLGFLDQYDGYRGWYSKVIREGKISKGSKILLLEEDGA